MCAIQQETRPLATLFMYMSCMFCICRLTCAGIIYCQFVGLLGLADVLSDAYWAFYVDSHFEIAVIGNGHGLYYAYSE